MDNPNFLILDEPTNDLDLITLEKLEVFLSEFGGCLIIVSHDRYFMDNLVDHYFVFEGNGEINDFNGTYQEYKTQSLELEAESRKDADKKVKQTSNAPKSAPKEEKKLSFKEKKEYETLEKEIAKLEAEKTKLETEIGSGKAHYDKLQELTYRYGEVKTEIEEKEFRWLELAERL